MQGCYPFKWDVKCPKVLCCYIRVCMIYISTVDCYMRQMDAAGYWASSLQINKDKRQSVLICSPVTPGFEVISIQLSSSPLGNSDPAWNSVTFIHIPMEIHPSVLFHSPPSWVLAPWHPTVRPSPPINTSRTLIDSIPMVSFSIHTSRTWF